MAREVRNLTVDDAFEIALKLMSEYSVRGSVQTGTKIADMSAKKFSYADSAQQEIAIAIPIEDEFDISHFKKDTLFNRNAGFDVVEHLNDDVVLMEATGALSYVFESNATSGTFEVQEETSEDTWELLGSAVSYTGTSGEFVTYKGHITAGDAENSVRIVLKGSYPYLVTNYTMYAITFSSDENIDDYRAYQEYDLPDDLREILGVSREGKPFTSYKRVGTKIYIDRDLEGIYTVKYNRLPKVIDDTCDGTEEFEIKKEAQHLIPYMMAALMAVEDKPEVSDVAFQEYERKFNLLYSKRTDNNKQHKVANTLWRVSEYGNQS